MVSIYRRRRQRKSLRVFSNTFANVLIKFLQTLPLSSPPVYCTELRAEKNVNTNAEQTQNKDPDQVTQNQDPHDENTTKIATDYVEELQNVNKPDINKSNTNSTSLDDTASSGPDSNTAINPTEQTFSTKARKIKENIISTDLKIEYIFRRFIIVSYEGQEYQFKFEDIEEAENSKTQQGGFAKILELVKISKKSEFKRIKFKIKLSDQLVIDSDGEYIGSSHLYKFLTNKKIAMTHRKVLICLKFGKK